MSPRSVRATAAAAGEVDRSALGEKALSGAPEIWQGLIDNPRLPPDEWESILYRARRSAERRAAAEGVRMYIPSLSSHELTESAMNGFMCWNPTAVS